MINGALLQKALLVQYFIICIVYLCEGNMNKAMYWFGALIITFMEEKYIEMCNRRLAQDYLFSL